MATTWTPERRARQAALIRSWRPWERLTGPRTADGKAVAAMNAFKGGQWQQMRALQRVVNAQIRSARDLVDAIAR
jgi:hypothetical protein